MSKPRILILTPAFRPNLGGVETHLTDLTEYLSTHGYFTYVLTYQPITTSVRGPNLEPIPNLEIHRYSWLSGNYFNLFVNLHPIFNFLYLTPYLGLRAFIFLLTHDVDVIHAIGLSSAFSARILKTIFHKPVIMSTETLFNFPPGSLFTKISRWVLSGLDRILAQSEQSRQELISIGLNPKKITVFSHWINQDVFKPANKVDLKKKLGWENKFTVLYVGRLIPEKGVRLVIESAIRIGPKISLKIIGAGGPELEFVQAAAQRHPYIKFLGGFSYRDLAPYYAAADVLIYPALYKEDMAYVLLDALSCGTPVINTNPGSGIYKLSPDSSFVILPTTSAIIAKINYLRSHPKKAGEMSLAAVKFSAKFGPALAKTITSRYDSLVK